MVGRGLWTRRVGEMVGAVHRAARHTGTTGTLPVAAYGLAYYADPIVYEKVRISSGTFSGRSASIYATRSTFWTAAAAQ